jgi:hypothetical protein|tara:strand:- start:1964 stop:2179 length:216 start_codon:yes stop_codon:yes gene_type:complete
VAKECDLELAALPAATFMALVTGLAKYFIDPSLLGKKSVDNDLHLPNFPCLTLKHTPSFVIIYIYYFVYCL